MFLNDGFPGERILADEDGRRSISELRSKDVKRKLIKEKSISYGAIDSNLY